jgi:hypothetical protein
MVDVNQAREQDSTWFAFVVRAQPMSEGDRIGATRNGGRHTVALKDLKRRTS